MIGWGKGWLTEGAKLVNVIPPKDQTGAAMTSLYVNLKNFKRLAFVIQTGALAAGMTAMTVTVEQATSGAGAGSKALAFDQGMAWSSVGQSQTAASDALVAATVSSNSIQIVNTDDNGVFIINLRDDMLDINNSFAWVCVKLTTPGANATLLGCLAVLYDGDNSGKESTLPTVVG